MHRHIRTDKEIGYIRKIRDENLSLAYIPEEELTSEICEFAIYCDSYNLEFVPERFKSRMICEYAVYQDNYNFKYVPDEYKSPTICKFAVYHDSYNLTFVPERLITCEMVMSVVRYNTYYIEDEDYFANVPKKVLVETLMLFDSTLNKTLLKYVV